MESIKKTNRNHLTWLDQYVGGSKRQNIRAWDYWQKFLGDKNEEWILDNLDSEDWGEHLINFRKWLSKRKSQKSDRNLSDTTTRMLANTIRGYFTHIVGHKLPLTKLQREGLTKVVEMPMKDYPFSLRTKEQLLRVANPTEDYVVSCGVSFGLRISDFLKITRGMLEPLMDRQLPIQLPPIQTTKKGVKAYPFISKDAYESIQNLLKEMDKEGRTGKGEPMLKTKTSYPEREINDTLKDVFKKADIPLGEFRVRFHILRKFTTDQLSGVCSTDKWKHFVGKETNTPYVSHEGERIFKEVMPFIDVNGRKVRSTFTNDQLEKMLKQRDEYIESLKTELEMMKKRQKERFEMVGFMLEDIGYNTKLGIKKYREKMRKQNAKKKERGEK
jgi:hypothetical protein